MGQHSGEIKEAERSPQTDMTGATPERLSAQRLGAECAGAARVDAEQPATQRLAQPRGLRTRNRARQIERKSG